MIATALPPAPPAIPWVRPGRDRFTGSPEEAARLFVAAGFPLPLIKTQFNELRDGECHVRDIRQGERIDAMVFGRARLLRNVVAEPDLWQSRAPRPVIECDVQHDGKRYALLWPFACGNWSEEITALSPVWGVPFAPPTGPLPGYAELLGGNEEAVGGFGGGGFGAFAGGWAAGASLSVAPREVSFVAPAPPIPSEYRARHWFRRHWHRAAFRFPVPTVPGVSTPPSTPPAHVPEPASAWIFADAIGLLAGVRIFRRHQ